MIYAGLYIIRVQVFPVRSPKSYAKKRNALLESRVFDLVYD